VSIWLSGQDMSIPFPITVADRTGFAPVSSEPMLPQHFSAILERANTARFRNPRPPNGSRPETND
jgi:hypothetical protein